MNKKRVDNWIFFAQEALINTQIVEHGTIDKNFRGQISSFGAAVVMGSLKSAVAFFAEKGQAEVDRTKLIQAMYYCVLKGEKPQEEPEEKSAKDIFDIVCKNEDKELKEKFVDASIALKLAMNFFELV